MRKQILRSMMLFLAALLGTAAAIRATAQYTEPTQQPSSGTQQPPAQLPESGPSKGVGETVIVPKRTTRPPEPKKPEPKPADGEQVRFRTEVDLVSVGVVVQSKNGDFLPGLKKENFRVYEDGAPQTIQRVEASEAPMTVAMVIEFSDLYWEFLEDTMQAAYGFVQTMRPEDWVAVIAFDMRPEILTDFTRNKQAAFSALNMMQIPSFREMNLFDAVVDASDRMQDIDGKKAILLISSGVDTFSKIRYDAVLKKLQQSDTPIYAVGTGQAARLWYEGHGYMDGETSVGFLQADNQLRTFAKYTGGRAYFPRFQGEFPNIYADIAASLRNEYVISYSPTNTAHDGKLRKLKVELIDKDGKPLKMTDPKGKEIKYEVRAREGYTAPRPVE